MIKSKNKLSNTEEFLMNILWRENVPLTSTQLLKLSDSQGWSSNYIHKMLLNLQEKGFISTCGIMREGKHYTRQFEPCFDKDEYITRVLEDKGISAASFARIAMGLVKRVTGKNADERNKKLVATLEKMLEEYKDKIEEMENNGDSECK